MIHLLGHIIIHLDSSNSETFTSIILHDALPPLCLQLDEEGRAAPSDIQQVADMPGSTVTQLCLSGGAAAVGTREGVVVTFTRPPADAVGGGVGVWQRRGELAVNGGVETLRLEAGMNEAVCAR